MSKFNELVYKDLENFVFGSSAKPVTTKQGIVIGGGRVIPELNFTLPIMSIDETTIEKIYMMYKDTVDDAIKRAVELSLDEYIIEIEVLPPMTYNPDWGVKIVEVVKGVIDDYFSNYGIKGVIRLTPVDIREDIKSPHMWNGELWNKILDLFRRGAEAGAELLSIESIGGKDIHDEAILYCDIKKAIFGLGVLGTLDMRNLWTEIVKIADETGTIAAGDTACGFANTAMVLAEKKYVPKVFSAIDRVLSGLRSLVAHEVGAVGPDKDCGYEGVYIKAITGTPISMEGKSSAVAHFSPLGNIAAAVADVWSNESIQIRKLLAGMAPTVSMEQLIYDCRLMNEATKKGHENLLRDLLVDSDSKYDPQAYVLRPDIVIELSKEMLGQENNYIKSKRIVLKTIELLRKGYESGNLIIDEKELPYLDNFEDTVRGMTDDINEFTKEMIQECSYIKKFDPKKYNL